MAAGFSLCFADDSQESRVERRDCGIAGHRDWREHRHIQRGGRPAIATTTLSASRALDGCVAAFSANRDLSRLAVSRRVHRPSKSESLFRADGAGAKPPVHAHRARAARTRGSVAHAIEFAEHVRRKTDVWTAAFA